jgi:hypothetical protein
MAPDVVVVPLPVATVKAPLIAALADDTVTVPLVVPTPEVKE